MKPALVSGIQPTGKLHLGNYLGALKNFVDLQNSGKYHCYFFIADLHSLTESFNPREKSKQILDLTTDYIAAGIGKNSVIFQQSEVPAHTELSWIFETIAPLGELERMTQFKDKTGLKQDIVEFVENVAKKWREKREFSSLSGQISQRNKKIELPDAVAQKLINILIGNYINQRSGTKLGLLSYPALMAADIVLYNASVVPVGEDQLQHLELARTLVRKFNNKFGKTFVEPKPLLTRVPRLMSLDDPLKKMSKSRPAGCLFMDDSPTVIREKLMRATTDSGKEIKYDPKNKPGISNLITIYGGILKYTTKQVEEKFKNAGYAEFKKDLAEVVVKTLRPFQERKKKLKLTEIKKAISSGNKKANAVASKKIQEVKKKIGLLI